jgi:hypothetical protein
MDPFEISLNKLLQERKKVAERIVAETPKEDYTDTSRLPFEINKTHQYLKQKEYEKNKKALKKLTDIV